MKEVDWEKPPREIRFLRNLKTVTTIYAQDVSVKPFKNLKIRGLLLEVFVAGSETVNITIGNGESFSKYEKIKDLSYYAKKGLHELAAKDLTYRLVDHKKLS